MTRAEKEILKCIDKNNGLINSVIASQETGYAISTCKRSIKKFENSCFIFRAAPSGPYFFYPSGERALEEAKK